MLIFRRYIPYYTFPERVYVTTLYKPHPLVTGETWHMKNKRENGRDTWTDQAIYVQVILHKPPISQGPTQT